MKHVQQAISISHKIKQVCSFLRKDYIDIGFKAFLLPDLKAFKEKGFCVGISYFRAGERFWPEQSLLHRRRALLL
jgi:hypothetical protein